MRLLVTVMVVALVLLPFVAAAQYETEDEAALRVRAGWFDMGDADSGLGIGVDYLFDAFGQKWLAGLEWGDADYRRPVVVGEAQSATLGARIDTYWGVTFNWVSVVPGDLGLMPEEDGTSWYYGGGIGWYTLDNSTSDDSFGAQVLAGYNFKEDWFGELRYVFATDMFGNLDADGIRLSIGYQF